MALLPRNHDEIEVNVTPLSSSSSKTPPVAAMDDNERGSCVAFSVEEVEVIDEGDADTEQVALLVSKVPVEKQKNHHIMTNHDELLYSNGYSFNGELPFFDSISGEGKTLHASKNLQFQ